MLRILSGPPARYLDRPLNNNDNNRKREQGNISITIWPEMEGHEMCCIPIKDGVPKWSLLPRTTQEHVPYLVCERPRLRICRKADLGDRATETEGDYFPFVLTVLDLRRHKRAVCRLSLLFGCAAGGADLS